MVTLEAQYQLSEEIERDYKNYKKDGADRKNNTEYFKWRWNKLEELWNEFQFNHDQLIQNVSNTDPYFENKQYDTTKNIYTLYKNLINSEYQLLQGQQTPSSSKKVEKQGESGSMQQKSEHGSYSKLDETLRKQLGNFKAFARTVSNIKIEQITEKWEFEDALKLLELRWTAIDSLHWEIDSELDGNDLEYEAKFTKSEKQYNMLKKEINKKMWSVSHREKSTPTLDIPVFSGSYTQWVSFKDLFNEAIHENPTLSQAQKMQFLKSKLRGEAERLIQHLTISSDNYLTSWNILNHRYNNERLIFTSHINVLFSLPTMQQSSLSHIKKMHDVTIETLHAINNLGVETTTWDPIIVHILSQKLDSETYADYLESVKNPRALPILQELLDFLESKFTVLETSSRRKQEITPQKSNNPQSGSQHFTSTNTKKQHFNTYRTNSGNLIAKTYHVSGYTCPLCNNEHGIYNCRPFLQMTNEKKLMTINRLGICVNCLFSHNGKQCNSSKTCRKCSGKHNTLIHEALEQSKTKSDATATSSKNVTSSSHTSQNDYSEVLLATAQLKVLKADGTFHDMRALIDQGSQISIITENAAQILGLKRMKCKGVVFGVGQRENNCKGKLNITCASMFNNYTFNTEVFIMNNLIKNLPNKTFPKPSWSNIENINLADPEFYKSRPVDLLLGADIYTSILLGGLIKGNDAKQPMAQQTQLGWLLCGSAQTFQCNVIINNMEDIQQFWEMEEITEEEDMSSEDIHCIEYFQKTTTRNEEGKYVVRLPMKPNFEEQLGASKPKAIAQFHNLENKFKKQENLAVAYKTFMNEYKELHHMKHDTKNSAPVECYLPHHGVERAESTTTKYRVVFNASSKTSTGRSLNDLMYKGPNLQQDLQSLLLKWRQYQYAFTADIEKIDSLDLPVQTFQLTTVTYGTKSAPFLAMMTLKRLAADESNRFPKATKVLEESFYMDDLVHGTHSLSEGKTLIGDLEELLKSGGFNLRKWATNNPELLTNISDKQNSDNNFIFNFKTENMSKTLGLCWSPVEDQFTFRYELPQQTSKLTKRILLSEISKIFDPLGWLVPITTKMKLLFQKVWKTNTQWDEEVSHDINKEWSKLRGEINDVLNSFKIQRWIQSNECDVIELHGFCDASMEAYGCVVYAHMKKQNQVILVAAKSKVVPIKKSLTLPKLELCGAHLLTKLISKIKQALQQQNIETYGWTDSQVVLGWLRGEPNRWKPFVANRVQKITEIMPEQNWSYVKTDENPADSTSRGLFPNQLKEHSLWWSAPSWLSTFEPEKVSRQTFETNEEQKVRQSYTVQQIENDSMIKNLLIKYSSFDKITRIVAWIQRAFTPKHKHKPSYLTLQELRNAKLTIIKCTQTAEYGTEINYLRKHGKVEAKSKLLNLNPFIDHNNILRVGGRLSQASISFEMKHPTIIPSDSRLAELLIDQAHKLTFHGGPRLTLAMLRQEYWIIGGNNTVKKQLRQCITCRKQDGKKQEQLMGDLPAARCNVASPFYYTGVDYTGFVNVKINKGRGARTTKGYVAIFICMVTKAVHMELVSELSTSAFLAALRRMAARRGAPCHIYSDNGTNFVGADRVLKEQWEQLKQIFNDSFLSEVTEMKIEFHFNAPAWPSAGGIWERAVRSLKHHLRRVVGEQKLTFEEYTTILTQIEACLNSRPLCPLTENIDDLDFLTPAHFLTGRSGVTVMETEEDARTRWHLTQKLFQDIWKRWKTEYLSQLTARRKWQKPQQNMEIGDMVVIHEDNLPAGKWAMGRVIEVHPGADGYVRVVTVKTKNGTMKRPVVKLSLLPLKHQSETLQPETQEKKKDVKKGRVYKSNLLTMAFMCIAILNMFTSGQCFQVTSLNEKQGLYFDKISNMQFIRDEWKIVAYYDMDPYWEATSAYEQYYEHLSTICQVINKSTHCNILMLQLDHAYSEIKHNNRNLLNQQLSARARKRRGLINGVGYLANSLFGVLDDRFAEQYQRDIAAVRDNQKHLALLWRNQTSVDMIQKQHKIINQHLLKLDKSTNILETKVNEMEYMSEFTLSAMAANNLPTHLKNIQDTLIDTITNVYNGKINMHLIDPQQLQNQLSIISSQLKDLTLPIDNIQTDLHNIYQLLQVKAKLTPQYLIFEIRIPLTSRDYYELYNIQSVPHKAGKNMVTLEPIEQYVAMNLQKDSYLPVTPTELEHCVRRDVTTYFCQLKTPIYKMRADKDFCVKDETDHCRTITTVCQNQWISLSKTNQYLFFCCEHCHLRTICNDQVTAHQLTKASIINIDSSCMVKTENFTIYTHKQQENRMEFTQNIDIPVIAPINHIINITVKDEQEETKTEINTATDLTEQLRDIKHNIEVMKENDGLVNDISAHDLHHYSAIWGVWAIVAIVTIVVICRRRGFCGQQQRRAAASLHAAATTDAAPEEGAAGPSSGPPPSPRNTTSEKCSESDLVNMHSYKDKGTTPVLRKIAFSENL
ncbi:hypothetical protein ABMA28_005563 [Loxostege sticticalis]|uniref:Integrase catalytic domain-containing protein n=1 Tax=Loxostege sticticalis TaxID=481309 RepID=A0ABD0SM33_LOXSC